MKKLLILSICFLLFQNMSSQSLSKFKWENRLVIVFTASEKSDKFQDQTRIFKNDLSGFKERKLKLIHAIPKKHKIILPESSDWQNSEVYKEEKESKSDFEMILIGLDGGVKLRQTEILETDKLFDIIDSMPMRQAEMRRKNN